MTDPLAIDLTIQDFVNTNRILSRHLDWPTLVSRRFAETWGRKVFSYGSGQLATAEILWLPESDWLCIELLREIPSLEASDLRFDCLRMLHQHTHNQLEVTKSGDSIVVKLYTKHQGLINVAFVIRPPPLETPSDPFLV